MNDIRHMSKEFLTEFIELYRQHPALWQVKSRCYVNRGLKNAGYDALVEFYRQVDPKVERDFVTKKIQSMRGSFRKELRKIEKSKRSGATGDNVYVSNLWYFDLLMFTVDQDTEGNNSPASETFNEIYDNEYDSLFIPKEDLSETQTSNKEFEPSQSISNKVRYRKRKHQDEQDQHKDFMKLCVDTLKHTDNTPLTESEAFGQYVIAKHANIYDAEQRMYAETLITQILNKAILDKLSESTAVLEKQ